MKRFRIAALAAILTIILAHAGNSSASVAGTPLVIADRSTPVRIVCSSGPAEREMGRYLIDFLRARHFAVKPEVCSKYSSEYSGPQWVLSMLDTSESVGAPVRSDEFWDKSRDEAFILDCYRVGDGTLVSLTGKKTAGLRAAVARLVCTAANYGPTLSLESGSRSCDPFIRLRILTVSNSVRRQVPSNSPFIDANCQTWDTKRLRAYPELFWQMGFNGMQVDEDRGYGSVRGKDLTRIQRALKAMMLGARDYHLFVSLSQWGDCLFDEGTAYCWNDPKQRPAMLAFMDELAALYGPLVDNISIRVGDPGGCRQNGCDLYKTPQELTTAYLKAFRKVNPSVTGTLSVWGNNEFWTHSPTAVDMSNYVPMFQGAQDRTTFGVPLKDGAKFLDETYMPKEVSIALNRYYSADQAEAVIASGRKVDIKGWYITDMEMINNTCIGMHTADLLLGRMPEKARDQVRSQSVELCFDGWPEIIGQYVAAQKLLNPNRRLMDIEREFCTAAFGPQNAQAMVDLYNACENGDADTYIIPIARPIGFGTAEYNTRLRRTLKEAEGVKLSADWKPNFAFPVPAQKYVDMLRARLRLSLAVSEAKYAVDTAKKRGASANEIAGIKKAAVKALPVLPIDPLYKQDASIVLPSYKSKSFQEMIEAL